MIGVVFRDSNVSDPSIGDINKMGNGSKISEFWVNARRNLTIIIQVKKGLKLKGYF